MSHCAVCCETFTGDEAGDAHRVGSFSEGTRRCLTPEEMRNRTVNGKPKPMVQNERGYWRMDGPSWMGPQDSAGVTETAENPEHG